MPGPHLTDDPVKRDLVTGRECPIDRNHVIELKMMIRHDRDPELQGCRIVGTEHTPDSFGRHRSNRPSRRVGDPFEMYRVSMRRSNAVDSNASVPTSLSLDPPIGFR